MKKNATQESFELKPEDSYKRRESDKIRQTAPDTSSGYQKCSVMMVDGLVM